MLTFLEKERLCEREFEESGPFWHLYTDGTQMQNIFTSDEEMEIGMALLAVSCALSPSLRLVTFQLMRNHIHLILAGEREACLDLFAGYKHRLVKVYGKRETGVDWSKVQAEILSINDLRSLRNEIIYTNRNAFVAYPSYTPFSYPWGGGCAYFSPILNQLPARSVKELGLTKARRLTHCRDLEGLENLKFVGETVFVPSFCSIDLGERMFHDARTYFNLLTRNAEAFSQIAARLKDKVFMTDDEIYAIAVRYAEDKYNCRLAMLTPESKIQLSKHLHFKYNASNQQLRRILKMDINILNEMFP